MDAVFPVEAALSDDPRFGLGTGLRQRPPRHTRSTAVLILASTVAVAVIVAWLPFCRAPRSTEKSPRLVQRQLSDSGEQDELDRILDDCLALREELGLEENVSHPYDSPETKKARLFLMLQESATAFEHATAGSSQALQAWARGLSNEWLASGPIQQAEGLPYTPLLREDTQISEWTTDLHYVPSKRMKVAADDSSDYSQISASQAGVSFMAPFSRDTSGDSKKGLSPDSWLSESPEQTSPQEFEQRPRHILEGMKLARFATGTSASGVSVFPRTSTISGQGAGSSASDGSFVGIWQGEAEHADQELLQAVALLTGNVKQREPQGYAVDEPQPSVSVDALLARKPAAKRRRSEEIERLHPFVRLPQELPKEITKTFDGVGALSSKVHPLSPMQNYVSMRRLFAKSSLTADDVEQLMHDCKDLIAYACRYLSGPINRTNAYYLARRLAAVFMVFDYLVSTIELLPDKMNAWSWWSQFAERFPTHRWIGDRDPVHSTTKELSTFADRLRDALAIYRTGVRPPSPVIIELKRKILTTLRRHCIFDNPLWVEWINDDIVFSQMNDLSNE
ncbi:uncharacterized protein EMH_0046580 [Eimeria mitis]|uniref:Transmembrane protein n=1 Tax=Eimeria mitis TaxID=44415 RepID=U6KHP4_9EIME|nr:uncharacterized protein EMH_0046580 [Eimeria mitis]CDJ36306.1 hypothetical protein EMH_0046580 [Eimeria mitis]